jgi:hypothetical protein
MNVEPIENLTRAQAERLEALLAGIGKMNEQPSAAVRQVVVECELGLVALHAEGLRWHLADAMASRAGHPPALERG